MTLYFFFMQDLVSALRDELSGDFEELVLALVYSPVEYDIYCLNDAIEGLGTREAVLIGIICSRTNRELEYIQEAYKERYGRLLIDDVIADTSGEFRDLLKQILLCQRKESDMVDKKMAAEDAKKLYQVRKNRSLFLKFNFFQHFSFTFKNASLFILFLRT